MSIKIHDNTLLSLRNYFKEKLMGIYPVEEIDSFFYLGITHYLGLTRLHYITKPNTTVSESDILRIRYLAKELQKHRPIQYIFGACEFLDLRLKVNEHVLIPRPETEEIVADIYAKVQNASEIIDLCTGSACIALALKKHYKKAAVTALDISEEALQLARQNAEMNRLEITFVKDDLLHLTSELPYCDLLVSNPPYVRDMEKAEMQRNVLDYEPALALFVRDDDPLIFYRAIIQVAVEKLSAKGWLFLEINEKFGAALVEELKAAGLTKNLSLNKDLNGKDRWISAQKDA